MEQSDLDRAAKLIQLKHQLYQSAQTSMGLVITDKCPVGCRHCISDNSLKSTIEPGISVLKSRIENIKKLGLLEKIVITGGEPFYSYRKLKQIIGYITENGLRVSVVTSAYWAKTRAKTREKLSGLKESGLQSLAISMDIYHQEKIPLQHIVNTIDACRELEIQQNVVFTWTGNQKKDKILLNSLKDSYPEYLRKGLQVSEGSILQSGRSLKNDLKPFGQHGIKKDHVLCQSMGKIIQSDGQVALCCGADLPDDSPLLAGNIDHEPLSVLRQKMESNRLIPFIEVFGLRWMYNQIEKEFPGSGIKEEEIYTSNRCNLCQKLLTHNVYRDFFRKKLDEESILLEIKTRYQLYFGYDYRLYQF
jgi:organic radical activating enzyme